MAALAVAGFPGGPFLIPGEVLESDDPQDARQWMAIYRELDAFLQRTLQRVRADAQDSNGSSLPASDADQRALELHLRRVQSRLEYWDRRFRELEGLDLDVERRRLHHAGRSVRLTRRETQLLAFLAQRPGEFFDARQLLRQAWKAPELSEEQVRTYVVRLRRLLANAEVRARLVSEPRRGYGLVFSS